MAKVIGQGKGQSQGQSQGQSSGQGKGPWVGVQKDTCRKHSDDSFLFTSIRYHNFPFAAPLAPPIINKAPLEKRLESVIGQQFLAGKHRFASVFTSVGVIIKPLFLCCVLPFYFVFYLIPIWLKMKALSLFKAIHLKTMSLISPIVKKVKAVVGFVKKIFCLWSRLKQLLHLGHVSFFRTDLKGAFAFFRWQKIAKKRPSSVGRFFRWAKNGLLMKENGLRVKAQMPGKLILRSIKAPFIAARRHLKIIFRQMISSLTAPFRNVYFKSNSLLNRIKIVDFVKKLIRIDWWKGHCVVARSKLNNFGSTLSHIRLAIAFEPLKKRWRIARQKGIEGLSQFLAARFRPFKILLSSLGAIINTPIEKMQYYKEIIQSYKSQVRHFVIHLPGRVRENFPILLMHYISRYQEYKLILYKKIIPFYLLVTKFGSFMIPKPVKTGAVKLYAFMQKCLTKWQLVKAWFGIRRREIVFMFLIFRIWARVLVQYAKRLILEYRAILSPVATYKKME